MRIYLLTILACLSVLSTATLSRADEPDSKTPEVKADAKTAADSKLDTDSTDEVPIPGKKEKADKADKSDTTEKKPVPDAGPLADVVVLPPSKRSIQQAKLSTAAAKKNTAASATITPIATAPVAKAKPEPAPPPPVKSAVLSVHEPGYTTVLSGTLEKDLELGPLQSPVLIKGTLVVPAGITLKTKAGTVIHLKADPLAEKPAQPGTPDPTQSAVIWIWGSFLSEGITGNPIEIINQEKSDAALMMYGDRQNKLEGTRLKNVAITQSGGICLWTNCELLNMEHYSLAAGVGVFTCCSFRSCGGIFATYNIAPWSLMIRGNIFEKCAEGIILGGDPGESRLIVEKNSFIRTRGATLRAVQVSHGRNPQDKTKPVVEILIGENWYGTPVEEEIDMRIVDKKADAAIQARINTRPPADHPYSNIGVGLPASVIAAQLREQQTMQQNLLKAHLAAQQKAGPEKRPVGGMVSKLEISETNQKY